MVPLNITRLGQAFRLAFEQVDLSDAPGFLPHFPEGCCSWATWMVGHYLKYECGLLPAEIQGSRDGADGTDTHAWLSVNGVVVDITCGQYSDCPHTIVIADTSEWHSRWLFTRTEEIRPISFHDSFTSGSVRPSDVYKRIEAHVRSQLTRPS